MRTTIKLLTLACPIVTLAYGCLTATADEPLNATALLRSRPASLLDVFITAANADIHSQALARNAAYHAGQASLIQAMTTETKLPKTSIDAWRNDCLLTFITFNYRPESDNFVARFLLNVLPTHPIDEKDLSAESNQARELFLKNQLTQASKLVEGGINTATLSLQSIPNSAQLADAIRPKVSVVVLWEIKAGENGTGKLLAAKAAAMRAYVAKGLISHDAPGEKNAPTIAFEDCEGEEAASRFFLQNAVD